MNDLLQRLRRERRVAVIHFVAFLILAVVVHLMGAAHDRQVTDASSPPPPVADSMR